MTLPSNNRAFRELHAQGCVLRLFNAWDAGSAKAIEAAGARTIATSSWAVAAAQGYADGETISIDHLCWIVSRIATSVSCPVSVDIERGYADTAEGVAETAEALARAGAIGFNIEDGLTEKTLREDAEQAARIAAISDLEGKLGFKPFINARTDVFFQTPHEKHGDALEKVIARASIYCEAGADGIFVPGLTNVAHVRTLSEKIPLPLNIMLSGHDADPAPFIEAGARRISYGPHAYIQAMGSLTEAAAARLRG